MKSVLLDCKRSDRETITQALRHRHGLRYGGHARTFMLHNPALQPSRRATTMPLGPTKAHPWSYSSPLFAVCAYRKRARGTADTDQESLCGASRGGGGGGTSCDTTEHDVNTMEAETRFSIVERIWLYGCLGILVLTPCASGKIASGTFTLAHHDFHYLTRFGCSIGTCPYEFRFRLVDPWTSVLPSAVSTSPREIEYRFRHSNDASSPPFLKLEVVLDEDWESPQMNRRPSCNTMYLSRVEKPVTLPLDGRWSEPVHGTLHQVIRPHIWYFIAADCQAILTNHIASVVGTSPGNIRPLLIEWEAEIKQVDGSHFSYELMGAFGVGCFHIFCYLLILCFLGVREIREMKRSGRLHTMIQMLNACVLSQLSSSLLHFCHLLAYSFNGRGLPGLDVVAEALAAVSQIVLSSVLLFIAFGYTLNVTTSQGLEASAMPVVALVTLLHISLFNADPRFKSHAADGLVGLMFTIVRLILWLAFVVRCWATANHPSTPSAVSAFLHHFAYAGSLYLLAYPAVFGATTVFAPYLQHKVITNGIFTMQAGSMLWLGQMFLTRGEFFKVSEFSQSYLPGGYFPARGGHRID